MRLASSRIREDDDPPRHISDAPADLAALFSKSRPDPRSESIVASCPVLSGRVGGDVRRHVVTEVFGTLAAGDDAARLERVILGFAEGEQRRILDALKVEVERHAKERASESE